MGRLQRHHPRPDLEGQHQQHQPQPPAQARPQAGPQQHQQQGGQGQQGPGGALRRPALEAIPRQGIGGGGAQHLQTGEGAEGGGVAVEALGHHRTDQHHGPGQGGPQGMAGPALGVEHLPGRNPREGSLGAIGVEGADHVVLAAAATAETQQGGGKGALGEGPLLRQDAAGVGLRVALGLAGGADENVGQAQRTSAAQRFDEPFGPHQGEGPGPLTVVRFEHLRRQGDPAWMAPQEAGEGGVIGRPLAAGPLEHHVDGHGAGAGLQQFLRHPAIGGPGPGEGAHPLRPDGDGAAVLEPVPLLQGGVIHRHQHHSGRRPAGAAQPQHLVLQSPLRHPPAGAWPAGGETDPEHQGAGEQGERGGAAHGGSGLRGRGDGHGGSGGGGIRRNGADRRAARGP